VLGSAQINGRFLGTEPYALQRSEDKPVANDKAAKSGQPIGQERLSANKRSSQGLDDNQPVPQHRVIKVRMWLSVENNNKFVRGKSRAREEIERSLLSRFAMEKTDKHGWNYVLSIPYTTDEELDRIIYEDIYADAQSIADLRHCFTEGGITSIDDPERSW